MSLRNFPIRLALLYLLIAGLWILISDRVVGLLISDPATFESLQTIKGWGFVLVTAVGLYLILRGESERLQRAQANLEFQSQLLGNTQDAIIVIDDRQQIDYWNRGAHNLYGWAASEALGSPVSILFPDGDQTDHDENFYQWLARQDQWLGELQQQRKDGSRFTAECSLTPILRMDRQKTQYILVCRDISIRIQQLAQVERLNRALLSISQVNQIVVRAGDEKDLLRLVCEALVRYGEYPLVWIGSPAEDHGEPLRVLAAAAAPPAELQVQPGSPQEGLDPETLLHSTGALGPAVALPMLSADRILGTLNIHTRPQNVFDPDEIQLLEEMANNLAYGLHALHIQQQLDNTLRQLRESEARFRKLIEYAPIGIATARQQRILYANQVFLEMFGYSELQEIAGKSLLELIAPEVRPQINEVIQRREEGQSVISDYETIGLRKDGSTFPYHTYAERMEMPEGPTTIGFFIDQTEIQQLAQERQAIIDASPLPLYSMDLDGHVMMWNPAAEAEFGWTAQEVLGQRLPIIPPHKEEEFSRLWNRVLTGDNIKGLEISRQRKDGAPIELSLHTAPIRSPGGRITGIMSAALNVTEKRHTDRALRHHMDLLQSIMDNAPLMISLIDPQGNFVWVNRAWETTLGYNLEDTRTQDIFAKLLKDPEQLQKARLFGRQAAGVWQDFKLETAQDEKIDISLVIVPLGDGNRINIAQNITERKHNERLIQQQAEQLEAMRQIGLEISSQLDLDVLLHTIAERGIELLGGDGGGLMLYNPESDTLDWVVRISPDGPLPDISLALGEGLSGRVWETGEPMWVDDYPTWEGRAPQYSQDLFHSLVVAPVRWGDEFLGVANIMSRQKAYFDAEDANLLQLFALQAAVAIKNARQYQAIEAHRSQLRALTSKLVEIEEAERKRLAAMLHDQVGQTLAALSIQLNMLYSQCPADSQPMIQPYLEKSQEMVEEVGERIRDVMTELRPAVLEEYGLLAAIDWYCVEYTHRTGLPVRISSQKIEPRLAPETEMTLFRVLQEALTNIAKHAQASQVEIELGQQNGRIYLSIQDDGIGIQTSRLDASRTRHWGLSMMRERILALNGTFDIQNNNQRGTKINIAIQRREDVNSHSAGG